MLRETLYKIGISYEASKKEPLKDHWLADYIRDDGKQAVETALGPDHPFKVLSSPGIGNWAQFPWIAVLNPIVTVKASEHYFVVYIFSSRNDSVFLSLNQGAKAIRDLDKQNAQSILSQQAKDLRAIVPEYKGKFSTSLSLGAKYAHQKDYEYGHLFGREYKINDLPSEDDLVVDLQSMMDLYSELFKRLINFKEESRALAH